MPYKNKEKEAAYRKRYYQENKEAKRIYMKDYRLRNSDKETNRAKYLKYEYGITQDEYNSMLQSQNFKCAICSIHVSELSRGLHIDHDHTTGAIRGLLCHKCNTALGTLGDSVASIENVLRYLLKSENYVNGNKS